MVDIVSHNSYIIWNLLEIPLWHGNQQYQYADTEIKRQVVITPKWSNGLSNINLRYNLLIGHDPALLTNATEVGYCTPRSQVAFAKTHKTGSSTLQNIFFRSESTSVSPQTLHLMFSA